MKYLISIAFVLALMGCAQTGEQRSAMSSKQYCEGRIDADTAMKLDLIEQLMAGGRLHAALAHLDNLDSQSLHARYLRAEILRQTGRTDNAEQLYETLLDTCMQGQGHHGLGLIAGRQQQLDKASQQLAQAARLLPVDARVRNDYGYVLLLKGELPAARAEFLTAMELDDQATLAATNMLLLLLLNNQQAEAESLSRRMQLDAKALADLTTQAEQIRNSSEYR